MKVTAPACRVRRSCASSAPLALSEMMSRIVTKVFSGTASSSRPDTDEAITFQPDHRMLTPTSIASAGSRIDQPVATAKPTPSRTPPDEITSVNRCLPSATKAGDRSSRP